MKKKLFHLLFIVIVVAELVGEYLQSSSIIYIVKPLLMIWIGAYFLAHSKNIDKTVVKRAGFGFLFSLIGDVFMMFSVEFLYFALGIGSFLVAQVFYAFLFLRTINISGKKPFLKKKPVWLILYIAFGLIVYTLLFTHLDAVLKVAIFIYMVAILIMSSMALNRYGNGHPISFSLVFSGSLLFVVSDSMIAINRFLHAIPFDSLLIMTTYIAAQFLIMKGILKQYE